MKVYITLYPDESMYFWNHIPVKHHHQEGTKLFEVDDLLPVAELVKWSRQGFSIKVAAGVIKPVEW